MDKVKKQVAIFEEFEESEENANEEEKNIKMKNDDSGSNKDD